MMPHFATLTKGDNSNVSSQKLSCLHVNSENLHPGHSFTKDLFSVTYNAVCMWTKAQNKKLHFQIYLCTCCQGRSFFSFRFVISCSGVHCHCHSLLGLLNGTEPSLMSLVKPVLCAATTRWNDFCEKRSINWFFILKEVRFISEQFRISGNEVITFIVKVVTFSFFY